MIQYSYTLRRDHSDVLWISGSISDYFFHLVFQLLYYKAPLVSMFPFCFIFSISIPRLTDGDVITGIG